jgi:hypothetical protein
LLPHRLVQLPQVSGQGWTAFNPSICADGDGWRVVLRTANYLLPAYWPEEQVKADGLILLSPDGKPRTQSFLLRLTGGWAEEGRDPLDFGDQERERLVMEGGVEDVRLFRWGEEWWGLGSCMSFLPRQRNSMGLFRLLEDGLTGPVKILHSPEGREREKNWMPWVKEGRLFALYSTSPWKVVEIDQFGAQVVHEEAGLDEVWSGSSQMVPFGDGFLGILHRRVGENAAAQYRHRFVFADRDFRPLQFGPEWVFAHERFEFCDGLAINGERAAISFGVGDCIPYVMEVLTEDLLRGLE